jgi:hypothetical protein
MSHVDEKGQPPPIAPSTVTSQWPPRIIAKEVSALKKEAPGNAVTVCLPALIRSQSSAPRSGKGPAPNLGLISGHLARGGERSGVE